MREKALDLVGFGDTVRFSTDRIQRLLVVGMCVEKKHDQPFFYHFRVGYVSTAK
ncbi:hypothetical protein [Rhizobium gallicum]|uniref:hypothetical protein n=1 Tax=Rhizobium gallicum TaxID=56730 RepID=UPI0012EC8B17|nr:hypothetical protein [Rhizobium gallicum]